MKKNGYLRSFLALFLAFVMIMADSIRDDVCGDGGKGEAEECGAG